MKFSSIKGLSGRYLENEIIASGSEQVLDKLRTALTVKNVAAEQRIKQLKNTKPYSDSHETKIKQEIYALEQELIQEYFEETKDGLSIPPGFYYLLENISEGTYLTDIKEKITEIKIGEKSGRYYQIEALNELLQVKRGMVAIATGCGKSLIISALAREKVKKGLRVILIVPTIKLVGQMLKTIKEAMPDKLISGIGGNFKYKEGSDVVVATINSGKNYSDIFDVVVTDEVHHGSSRSYWEMYIRATKAKYFYGFTATPCRADNLELGFHAIYGPVVYEFDSLRAIREGFLCDVSITCLHIKGLSGIRPGTNDKIAYKNLCTQDKTINVLFNLVKMGLDKNFKILVLFKTVEPGREFCEFLSSNGIECQPAHGDYWKPFYDFENGETSLLISNSSLLGEGIDLPEIDYLISIVQNGSESLTRQIIGRGLRLKKDGRKLRFIDISTAGMSSSYERADGSKTFFDYFLNKGRQRRAIYETITNDIVEKEV